MKKIFLGLAVLAFIGTGMTACKDKKKEDAKTEQTGDDKMTDGKMSDGKMSDGKMESGDDKMSGDMASSNIEVPSFSDPEVTKWCQDYKSMLDNLMAAYTSKDATKIASLNKDWSGWATKSSEIAMKFTQHPEEAARFSTFVQAVSAKYAECVKMNMPH